MHRCCVPFPVFTDNDKSLRVWVEFAEVTEKANGTADKATWHVHFSASANDDDDTLGIMLDDGRNTLPGIGTYVADYIYTIMGNFTAELLGIHELTFLDGTRALLAATFRCTRTRMLSMCDSARSTL